MQALQTVSSAFRAWGAKAKVTRPLRDGETLELRDRTLRGAAPARATRPSDTIFWDERAPDPDRGRPPDQAHLLQPADRRPLDDAEATDPRERPQALVTYLESLRKTRELPAEIVLSGHGEPITDHVALIDERFEFHRRRADKIHELIAERPRTGYDLAQALFGDIAVTQAYLTLSEVLGHVDLLLNEGRVREVERDGVA